LAADKSFKSKYNIIFMIYAGLCAVYAHVNLFFSVTEMKKYALTGFFVFLSMAVIFIVLSVRVKNIFYSLSVVPAFLGAAIFYFNQYSFGYYFLYFFAALLLIAGYARQTNSVDTVEAPLQHKELKKWYAWVFIVLAAVFILADRLYQGHDSSIEWYMALRHRGKNMDGMSGVPFTKYYLLIYAFLFIVLITYIYWLQNKGRIKNTAILLVIAVLTAFSAKFIAAVLSSQGLLLFYLKTAAAANTAYFFVASQVDSLKELLANYVTYYQGYLDSSHVKGHPPLPVIFYWLIIKYISASPDNAAFIYSFITSFTVIPVFFITRILTGSTRAAFWAAMAYSLTPNSMMLAVAGADGMTLMLVAFFLWMILEGNRRKNPALVLISGLLFGIATLYSFGVWPLLMFVLLMLPEWKNITHHNGFKSETVLFLRNAAALFLGITFVHLAFWAVSGGMYDYAASFKMAALKSLGQMLSRSYLLWGWLNVFHFAGYMTAPITALLILAYYRNRIPEGISGRFMLMTLALLITQFSASVGRSETHRMYMFLAAFIIPVAATALFGSAGGNSGKETGKDTIAILLVFINSVLISVLFTDCV